MLIELKNIFKDYRTGDVETSVLSDVSFNIAKGEFTAIMGPSGSGKSTLMHIIGLLDRPSSGVYTMDDKDTSQINDDDLAFLRNQKIGFVFQSFHLLSKMTVLENVKLPLIYSRSVISEKEIDERARAVLDSVGLSHRVDYLTNQISGGEKQRTAIARALIGNPDVILADEPTGNLDSKSGLAVMKILDGLNKKGRTIILVTHESETAGIARRIIKIADGKIVSDQKNGHRAIISKKTKIK